ncbi:MAG: hypothetical protein VX891_01695, partial [Candidatus Thermoplasmatota archaeon]|nr:hypothetical protein [Candidatus Thermoplasmatota archaeon]
MSVKRPWMRQMWWSGSDARLRAVVQPASGGRLCLCRGGSTAAMMTRDDSNQGLEHVFNHWYGHLPDGTMDVT